MSSGEKAIVVNPLERAVSTDINRLQAVLTSSINEMLRAFLDTGVGSDDVNAAGLYEPSVSAGNPPSAVIFNGLLFTPAVGSAGSTLTPGVLGIYDPDALPSTDDSQWKLVVDPGTTALALATNSSGQPRIDIIECSRTQPDAVIETDSRDVFNTTTGIFTAATVNKVTQAQLAYRIRAGTPGAGFPGTVAEWTPLAVALVPTGSTTWDTCFLWDVRPLYDARAFSATKAGIATPQYKRLDWATSGTGATIAGLVDVWTSTTTSGGNGSAHRLGGQLRPGSPITDVAFVDITNTANREAGFSSAGGSLVYLYLLTPFGLSRWARYTDASSGSRLPRSPRGIPLLSSVAPQHWSGLPSSAIVFPSAFGFNGASTQDGVCIGALYYAAGATSTHFFPAVCANRAQNQTVLNQVIAPTFSGATATTFTASIIEGTHIPPGVKRIRMGFFLPTIIAGGTIAIQTFTPIWQIAGASTDQVNGENAVSSTSVSILNQAVGNLNWNPTLVSDWLPLPTAYPSTAAQTYTLQLKIGSLVGSNILNVVSPIPNFYILDWEW